MAPGPIQRLPRLGIAGLALLLALTVVPAGAGGAIPALPPQLSEAESEAAVRAGVAAVIAAYVPPPGGLESASEPAGDGGLLPATGPTPPAPFKLNEVNSSARWWTLPGTPAQALSYVQAHPPADSMFAFSILSTPPGVASAIGFEWPAVPRATGGLRLEVKAVPLTDGSTGLEAVAHGFWLTPRPSSEVLPTDARVLRVTLVPSRLAGSGRGRRVTITSRRRIERVVELLDALPASQPTGPVACPRDDGEALRLAFYGAHGGSPLAVAQDELSGCGGVSLTIAGRSQHWLDSEGDLLAQVSAAIGVKLGP